MAQGMLWRTLDNSGIKVAKQLKIQKSNRTVARPGDFLTIFPKKYRYVKSIKRQTYMGLVVMLKRPIRRFGGYFIRSYSNRILVLSHARKFLGSRIFGPLYREVRRRRTSYIYKRIYARTGYFI